MKEPKREDTKDLSHKIAEIIFENMSDMVDLGSWGEYGGANSYGVEETSKEIANLIKQDRPEVSDDTQIRFEIAKLVVQSGLKPSEHVKMIDGIEALFKDRPTITEDRLVSIIMHTLANEGITIHVSRAESLATSILKELQG